MAYTDYRDTAEEAGVGQFRWIIIESHSGNRLRNDKGE